ncbi:MAG TPA: hypothetical protein DCF68_10245 [Cyanothece sp. UBA12306]|nr:hypothetical protein [Cyanothece sp. UBA12306]
MLKRLIAPIFVSTIVLTFLTLIGLNHETLAQSSEANLDYFIKPITNSNLIVVEPNYGRFYNPYRKIEGDSSGEILYSSLEDLASNYEIKSTKMVRFERKGQIIPNLYVSVNSPSLEQKIAEKVSSNGNTVAGNF